MLLVTDAGMPSVSDPGYRLVAAAVAEDITVTAVPGPSAVLTALAVSGLPVDRFCFEGFLPRKAGERARRLAGLAAEQRTMVFFEAPHRTEAALAALADAFGDDRPGAVCRELTKTHEEVRRGSLRELAVWAADGIRGEVTLVVQGAEDTTEIGTDPDLWRDLVAELETGGMTRKDAILDVARRAGVPKREVYDAVHKPTPRGRSRERAHPPPRGHRGEVRQQPRPHPPAGPRAAAAPGRRQPLPPRHRRRRRGRRLVRHEGRDRGRGGRQRHPDRADRLRPARRPLGGPRRRGARRSWSPVWRCTPTRRPGWPRPASSTRPSPRSSGWRRAATGSGSIGETGLDHFRTGPDGRAAQVESFRRHIEMAKRLDKVLMIHDRDAHDEVLQVIDEEGAPDRWVMHCFSGDAAVARACLDRGAHLSFAGTVTFKNAEPLRGALRITPQDRVLVETDAPFLTPMPYRGRPNASYLVPHTMRAMAEVRGDDLEALCRAVDATTTAVFGAW